jgi:hypothetical protein
MVTSHRFTQGVVIADRPICDASTGASKLTTEQIADLTSTEAIDLLCARKLTAVEYATALLERAKKFECINSFAFLRPEQVHQHMCMQR